VFAHAIQDFLAEHAFSSPGPRGRSERLGKPSTEMRLICEPAVNSDLAERRFSGQHQVYGVFDATAEDVLLR
jgi:hypothetical protein